MIKTEIKGLKEVENFLLALADNLVSVVKEEIAAGASPAGKLPHRRDTVALRRTKRAGRRNFQVPGLDPGKRGGA